MCAYRLSLCGLQCGSMNEYRYELRDCVHRSQSIINGSVSTLFANLIQQLNRSPTAC